MKIEDKEYNQLMDQLDKKLKEKNRDIVFLELNKDIYLNNKYNISENIPLPIRSKDLINGIETNEYNNNIPFERIIESMLYIIGCDSEFKYNNDYMEILKRVSDKIDTYVLHKALALADDKKYMDALILFRTLDKISDKHMYARHNIANTLRQLALEYKDKNEQGSYELFYRLSYAEFLKLSREYPESFMPHYYLGFYSIEEKEYDEALFYWKKAFELADDESAKKEISNLMDAVKDNILFEEGKEKVLEGVAYEGLKILIPLIEKHNDWSEAKYYTALGYRKIENYKKAELLLRELLDSGESFSEIYNELGLCCLNLDNINESIEKFHKAVELKPYEQGYLCNLGIAYYYAGNIKSAKEYIDRAYELKPVDELTEQCKKWIDQVYTSNIEAES